MKRIVEATLAGLIALSFAIPTAPNVPDRGQLEPIKAKSERTAASVKPHQTNGDAPNFDLTDLIEYLTADFKNAAERAIDGRRCDANANPGADDGGRAVLCSEPLPETNPEPAYELEQEFVEDSGTAEAYEPDLTYLGEFRITFYDLCPECTGPWYGMNTTASGRDPVAWWTVAAGPSLPFGTLIYIEGFGTFEVMDRGVADGQLDILVNNHSEIPSYGMTITSVYLMY